MSDSLVFILQNCSMSTCRSVGMCSVGIQWTSVQLIYTKGSKEQKVNRHKKEMLQGFFIASKTPTLSSYQRCIEPGSTSPAPGQNTDQGGVSLSPNWGCRAHVEDRGSDQIYRHEQWLPAVVWCWKQPDLMLVPPDFVERHAGLGPSFRTLFAFLITVIENLKQVFKNCNAFKHHFSRP